MISSVILTSINIQLIKLVTFNSDQVLIGISQSMVNQQSHKSRSSIATDWQNKQTKTMRIKPERELQIEKFSMIHDWYLAPYVTL